MRSNGLPLAGFGRVAQGVKVFGSFGTKAWSKRNRNLRNEGARGTDRGYQAI
jgi:hypothetical protein